jgi:MFS family permease
MTLSGAGKAASAVGWRTPLVIIVCGCLIGSIGYGPRAALGLFQTPILFAHGWGGEVFSVAIALQILVWGTAQPFVGAIADRFGLVRVLVIGALLYAAGISLMAYSTTPLQFDLTAGLLLGLAVAGTSFTLVIAAFGKLLPPEWRSISFGAGTAAGSFGQFLFAPMAVGFIDGLGWQHALVAFGGISLLIVPLAFALRAPQIDKTAQPSAAEKQSLVSALVEAFGHRSYILLVLGFFTCGFQLLFITVHLPRFLVENHLSNDAGAYTLAVIGIFNIVGSLTSGWLGQRMPFRYLLSIIYLLRSIAVIAFISVPVTMVSALAFGAAIGLLWLSTVPPTSSLVAVMFGTRWMATLFGFAFFSHQVGGSLGVWLGGFVFERTGSYNVVWWISVVLGLLSALINLPIVEKPIARPALSPA